MPRRITPSGYLGKSLLLVCFVIALGAPPTVAADTPSIRVDGLQQGAAYSGLQVPFVISFRASDPEHRVTRIEIAIDGKIILQKTHHPPAAEGALQATWDTTAWADGKHTVTVKAIDQLGESDVYSLHVYVNNGGPDRIAPQIRVTRPAPGEVVSGRAAVRVQVADNVGVRWVVIYVDESFQHLTNAPPYPWEWDTTKVENGPHEIWAQAIDASNLESESERIPVIVNNPGGGENFTQIQGRGRREAAPPAFRASSQTPRISSEGPWSLLRRAGPGGRLSPSVTPFRPPLSASRHQSAALSPVPGVDPTPRTVRPSPARDSKSRFARRGPTTPAGVDVLRAGLEPPGPRLGLSLRVPPMGPAESSVNSPFPQVTSSVPGSLSLPWGSQAQVAFSPPRSPAVGIASGPRWGIPVAARQRTTVDPRGARIIAPPQRGSHTPAQGQAPGPPRWSPAAGPATSPGEAGGAPARPVITGSARVTTPRTTGYTGATRISLSPRSQPKPTSAAHRILRPFPLAAAATLKAPESISPNLVAARASRSVSGPQQPRVAGPSRTGSLSEPPHLGIPGPIPNRQRHPGLRASSPQMVGWVHIVQPGDTVFRIAQRYGLTVDQIARVNRLGRDYRIRPGQRLVLHRSTGSGIFFDQQPVAVDVSPFQQQGIPVAPFRHIFEHQGGVVGWRHDTKELLARDDHRTVRLAIGSPEAQINQEKILMDLAAFIEQGRTMVPLRFISQALDVTVQVDPHSGNIFITSNR